MKRTKEGQKTMEMNAIEKGQNGMGDKRTTRKRIKNKIRIETWYVRTLLAPVKMKKTARELQRYKVDVAWLQEMRWSEEGKIKRISRKYFTSGWKAARKIFR